MKTNKIVLSFGFCLALLVSIPALAGVNGDASSTPKTSTSHSTNPFAPDVKANDTGDLVDATEVPGQINSSTNPLAPLLRPVGFPDEPTAVVLRSGEHRHIQSRAIAKINIKGGLKPFVSNVASSTGDTNFAR